MAHILPFLPPLESAEVNKVSECDVKENLPPPPCLIMPLQDGGQVVWSVVDHPSIYYSTYTPLAAYQVNTTQDTLNTIPGTASGRVSSPHTGVPITESFGREIKVRILAHQTQGRGKEHISSNIGKRTYA